jgi:hypothetical protein
VAESASGHCGAEASAPFFSRIGVSCKGFVSAMPAPQLGVGAAGGKTAGAAAGKNEIGVEAAADVMERFDGDLCDCNATAGVRIEAA